LFVIPKIEGGEEMVKIAPSILSANFEHLEEEIKDVVNAGADMIHVDVMDGKFVPNETPGIEMYQITKRATNLPIDTHLMVKNPEKWIDQFLQSDRISFHIETVNKRTANRMIDKLHEHHIKACIAIKPKTPVEAIIPFIDKLDMILVMTVEPGFGGQQMIESCLEKVRTIRQLNTDIDIEVDGGVNIETVKQVKKAGANVIVAGTAIFQSKNKEEMIKMFKN